MSSPVALLLFVALGAPEGPVYPARTTPLHFTHRAHAEVDCATCHPGARESVRPGDRLLPSEAACFACHDPFGDEDPPKCAFCHPGYAPTLPPGATSTVGALPRPPALDSPPAALRFGHALHARAGVECATCHVDLDRPPGQRALPTMAECVDCHTARDAPARCDTCHLIRPDGRLRLDLPAGALKPTGRAGLPDHGGDWARSHGPAAAADAAACATCHAPEDCARCHTTAARRPDPHPGLFLLTHAPAARRNDPDCSACHRLQTFCVDCHAQSGVTAEAGPLAFQATDGARRFHPPGFVGSLGGAPGPEHHRYAARANLASCVGCHRESTCVTCHAADAPAPVRASPHPPGFDCGRVYAVNTRGCAKCHGDAEALRRLCDR